MNNFILCGLLLINAITFAVYGVDKAKAIRGAWRIPEKVLILLAAFGGGIGALLGMIVFRHKIRKPKFFFGVPAILAFEIIIFFYLKSRLFP